LKYLRQTFGPVGLAIVFAGLTIVAWRAVRGPRRVASSLLVIFPALYFVVMAGSRQIYARYTLPLLPLACLLAALAAAAAMQAVRTRMRRPWAPHAAALATWLILTAPLAVSSIRYDRRLGRMSTQDLAYQWLETHAEAGAAIVAEGFVLRLPASRFRGSAVLSLIDKPYERYAAEGVQYLVASSDRFGPALTAPERNPAAYDAYQTLFVKGTEIARFNGTDDVPGPDIRIYRVGTAR
jgi:hypothetical protein